MLREKFTQELKTSTLAKDAVRTNTIRMIIAEMKKRDINARTAGNEQASEDELLQMMQSMIKQRKESIDMYTKANRPELADKEQAEITIISEFMPKQMDDSEIDAAIVAAIAETGAESVKDMGKVIGILKAKFTGQMDFGKASGMVKQKLGA